MKHHIKKNKHKIIATSAFITFIHHLDITAVEVMKEVCNSTIISIGTVTALLIGIDLYMKGD